MHLSGQDKEWRRRKDGFQDPYDQEDGLRLPGLLQDGYVLRMRGPIALPWHVTESRMMDPNLDFSQHERGGLHLGCHLGKLRRRLAKKGEKGIRGRCGVGSRREDWVVEI